MPPVLIVFQLNTTNTGGVAKDADYLPLTNSLPSGRLLGKEFSEIPVLFLFFFIGFPDGWFSAVRAAAIVGISFKEEVTAGTDPDIVVLHFHRVPFR